MLIGGGFCSLTLNKKKCPGSFNGGTNGGDGHGSGPFAVPGQGTGVSLDQYSMEYFNLSPGFGGTADVGINGPEVALGGGGGGVLVDGFGPNREAKCQGEGYGGGGGGMTTGKFFKWNNPSGHFGLPGVILVELY